MAVVFSVFCGKYGCWIILIHPPKHTKNNVVVRDCWVAERVRADDLI